MKKIKSMTPEQITKIKELYSQGMTSYQIAKVMKIAPHVTKYHTDRVLLERAKELTIPLPPKAPFQERLEEQEALSDKQKNKLLLDIVNQLLAVH